MDLGAMEMEGCSAFPKAPALLEPHHQIVLCHNQDTHWGKGLTPLQRCIWCILQTQVANSNIPRSAGALESTDCFSVKGYDNSKECPRYDSKQSEGEAPVILELWRIRTSSLLSLLGPIWSGVVAPDCILSMGQIELNRVLKLNWIVWNRTVLTFTRLIK